MTTTVGTCKECRMDSVELIIKEKFCSEKCYDAWSKKQAQITCRGVCAYKFCGNEDALKYNGRYCSKMCKISQSRDNNARKKMLDEGLPIETIDRRIKRSPVDKANYLFGDMAESEERKKRINYRRRNTETEAHSAKSS